MIEYAVISKQKNDTTWTVHSKTTYRYSFYKTEKAVRKALARFEKSRIDMIDYLKSRLTDHKYIDITNKYGHTISGGEFRKSDENFLKEYEDKIYKIGYWTDENSPMYLLGTNEEIEIKKPADEAGFFCSSTHFVIVLVYDLFIRFRL